MFSKEGLTHGNYPGISKLHMSAAAARFVIVWLAGITNYWAFQSDRKPNETDLSLVCICEQMD